MIYTLTLNPSIDYHVELESINIGAINKYGNGKVFFGGKGINVSKVLKVLDYKSVALGFVAGFTGEAVEKGLDEKGITTKFVHLDSGMTRINFKIKGDSETEINGKGPLITEKDMAALFETFNCVACGDILVLAGSLPENVSKDFYSIVMDYLSDRNVKFVVDTTGEALLSALKYKPFLIKPNNYELGELFGTEITTHEKALFYAGKLQEMGAKNVLVSMGEKGAVLLDENKVPHTIGICKGEVKNTVGAGDSMLAGFIVGSEVYIDDYDSILRLATASGAATAFSEDTAEDYDTIFALAFELEKTSN